jgi:hypothetical protein
LPLLPEIKNANLIPNPTFSYRILDKNDEGKNLSANSWKIRSGVKMLEKNLFF